MLLLCVLRVFAVKILGSGMVLKEGNRPAGGGYCSKKMHLPRIYTVMMGKLTSLAI
jgi:hypothetical protein